MQHDPHESGTRPDRIQKNEHDEQWLEALNTRLAHAELPEYAPEEQASLPIVYIVGAPRSGTTLLSQVLCHCLDVGYITNLTARFWQRPSVGIRLGRILLGKDPGAALSFNSVHGTTREPGGPHEFGYFWRHWLQLDTARTHHLTEDELGRIDGAGLTRALETEILRPLGKPLVTKNVVCGFQAAYLSSLHPASLFLHISRDSHATARSILNSRMARYGSYTQWWSLKPSAWPFPAASPAEEVALQVRHCRNEFETELARGTVHFLPLAYEDLCRDPNGTVQRVVETVHDLFGVRIATLRRLAPFTRSESARLSDSDEAVLDKILH